MMLPTVPVANLHILHRFPPRIYMNDGELDLLVGLFAGVTPKAILEFGVNVGITARAMLENLSGIQHYQGIDLAPGGITTLPGQWTEVPDKPGHLALPDKRFELILRPHGSFDLRPKDLISADAIFIDGDHSYNAVMHDSRLAFDLIREGGIVVWHDYLNPTVEVTAALDDLAQHEHRRIYHIEGTWLAFCRF
jgi:predicted O-methyltransferase YrrM